MKTRLIKAAAFTGLAICSSIALAGGPNCDAHKGGHKDMSAQASKEFKENHSWLFPNEADQTNESAATKEEPAQETPHQRSTDLVEI